MEDHQLVYSGILDTDIRCAVLVVIEAKMTLALIILQGTIQTRNSGKLKVTRIPTFLR